MKYLAILLFAPFHLFAQSIEFFGGAGIAPRHIECLSKDSGWVQLTIGPMSQDGPVFMLNFFEHENIESVTMWQFERGVKIKSLNAWGKNTPGIMLKAKSRYNQGEQVLVIYQIKRKKA
jgi:hypothetical protein